MFWNKKERKDCEHQFGKWSEKERFYHSEDQGTNPCLTLTIKEV